jgi:hypothetical protein
MKATLQFDLPDERDSFEDAVHGSKWHDKFERVWQDCFRGRHKHGYPIVKLNELLEGEHGEAIGEYLDLIETIYHNISDSFNE